MKLTKKYLENIIKEETRAVLKEAIGTVGMPIAIGAGEAAASADRKIEAKGWKILGQAFARLSDALGEAFDRRRGQPWTDVKIHKGDLPLFFKRPRSGKRIIELIKKKYIRHVRRVLEDDSHQGMNWDNLLTLSIDKVPASGAIGDNRVVNTIVTVGAPQVHLLALANAFDDMAEYCAEKERKNLGR